MEEHFYADHIELEPFIHQVGGHSFMLSLDGATVCKPVVQRELQFYETIPDGVQKFMPKFYGVISVKTVQTGDGYVKFIALPPANYIPVTDGKKHKIRIRKTGSIEIANPSEENLFQEDQIEGSIADTSVPTRLNPWVLKCHKDNMSNLLRSFQNEEQETKDFIVLENLTRRFTCPCVLDLKMGTRQYGDAATLAKKQSKMYKVVSTTSAKLGLRVGGMQVYQVPSKHYLCRNKFYGRTLSVGGFQQALVQFLHNGARFRSDVLPVLIRRLEELRTVLGRQETIRFYTTSLLLLYEGEDGESETLDGLKTPEKEKLHKQDSFKRLTLPTESDVLRKTSSAESLTAFEGNDCLEKSVQFLRRRSSAANFDSKSLASETSSNTSSDSTIFEDCCDTVRRNSKSLAESLARSFSTKSDSSSCVSEPAVDVKMIDFAHSTHKDLDDPIIYTGPDRGFLFGLEKLISILKSIENDYG